MWNPGTHTHGSTEDERARVHCVPEEVGRRSPSFRPSFGYEDVRVAAFRETDLPECLHTYCQWVPLSSRVKDRDCWDCCGGRGTGVALYCNGLPSTLHPNCGQANADTRARELILSTSRISRGSCWVRETHNTRSASYTSHPCQVDEDGRLRQA